MKAAPLNLLTDWALDAPRDLIWDALMRPQEWPLWWRAVERVELLTEGDGNGVGATRRFTWRTALPYTLTFDMRTTRVEPKTMIEGRAVGELDGVGRWTLSEDGAGTK